MQTTKAGAKAEAARDGLGKRNLILEAAKLALDTAGIVLFIAIIAAFCVGMVFVFARDAWAQIRGTSC